jgi:hypothetical protein
LLKATSSASHQGPQLLALGFGQPAVVVLGHEGVEPFLLGRPQASEFSPGQLESNQVRQGHLADVADHPGHAKVETFKGLMFLAEAVQALQVDAQAPLPDAPVQLGNGHLPFPEDAIEK